MLFRFTNYQKHPYIRQADLLNHQLKLTVMQNNHFGKAALLTLLMVLVFFAGWEWYLRNNKVDIAYDDGKELWSDKRARVYQPKENATVFIGSSRIKYDLDIPTWRKLTGEDAVQLAMEGSSPLPALDDLAADEDFKGKLIIDVTEGLFFSLNPGNLRDPLNNVAYYAKRTPAEKVSFTFNRGLESQLVFLDRDNYSINAMLEKLRVPDRKGVFNFPIFPMEFGRTTFDRQAMMTEEFLMDTGLQNQVKDIWNFFRKMNTAPPASGRRLDSILNAVNVAVKKVRSRGGQVLFVRTPSSGPLWMGEQKAFARDKYWDQLLRVTAAPGIHFADYPAISHFQCPELSHLSPHDAILFTEHFVDILQKEKGWKFSNPTRKQNSQHQN